MFFIKLELYLAEKYGSNLFLSWDILYKKTEKTIQLCHIDMEISAELSISISTCQPKWHLFGDIYQQFEMTEDNSK